jgi:hypothetical protein
MMTPEERVEKRTLLMGLLLVRDSDMERVHGIIEKCNAMRLPLGMARMMGILPGPDELLGHLTLANAREAMDAVKQAEAEAVKELQQDIGPMGLVEAKAPGQHTYEFYGAVADLIIDLLTPDNERINALVGTTTFTPGEEDAQSVESG